MDIKKIISTLHPLERKVLPLLDKPRSFDYLVDKSGLQKVEVMRALQWLQNKKLIRINQKLQEQINLDENGKKYREKGLPEKTFLNAVKSKIALGALIRKTNLSKDEIGICLGVLKKNDAIKISKKKELEIEKK